MVLVNSGFGQHQTEFASRGLKVLVLDEWIPYPPDSGKRVRTWNLLRRLARCHEISLLCYGDPECEAAHVVRTAGITLHAVPPLPDHKGWPLHWCLFKNLFSPYPFSVSRHYTRRFRERLQYVLEGSHFDLVHFEWTPYARFRDGMGDIPDLIMAHNIECQIWSRRAQHSRTLPETYYFALQATKMKWFERRVMRRVRWVTVVTELDAQQVRAWGVRGASLVENGVDVDLFVPLEGNCDSDEILFLAALDWYPNQDALDYMLRDVFPLILQARPSARLRVVGRRPPASLKEQVARYPGSELVGEVGDVRPYLTQAAVVVVPLRIGGGSRVKILEALAMGKAVVSTSVGAEGLAVIDGVHLLLADTPADFAAQTVRLLKSAEERLRLGENGRGLVVERYSWDRMARALEWAWQQACSVRGGGESLVLPAEARTRA